MGKRVQAGKGGVRVVDGGSILVETVGPFFVQDGPTDNDRVRFRRGDRALVTAKLRDHLVSGGAVVVLGEKKKSGPAEDKAVRPQEDKDLFE